MQVRPGNTAGGADQTQDFAPVHHLLHLDVDLGQMKINREHTLPVVHDNGVPIEKIISGLRNPPAVRGTDGRAFGCRNIGARMRVARLIVEPRADGRSCCPDRPVSEPRMLRSSKCRA